MIVLGTTPSHEGQNVLERQSPLLPTATWQLASPQNATATSFKSLGILLPRNLKCGQRRPPTPETPPAQKQDLALAPHAQVGYFSNPVAVSLLRASFSPRRVKLATRTKSERHWRFSRGPVGRSAGLGPFFNPKDS